MYKKAILISLLLVFVQFYPGINIYAADLTGPISGTYSSTENISTQGNCYVAAGSTAALITPNTIILNPGFHVILGGSLSLPFDSDNDGLRDSWEIAQFGNLSQTGSGDFDNDGVSNYLEFIMGFDSRVANIDHDNDGIPDWYELQQYGNLTSYNEHTGEGDCD
jgi:hypothetical protein